MYKKLIADIPSKEYIKGFHGKMIHMEKATLAFWTVEAGAELPMHSHENEQTTQVTSGRFEMVVGGETHICEPGAVVVIPANVEHGGRALTDCTIMDIFVPVRDVYL